MRETIDAEEVLEILHKMAEDLESSQDYLTELDSAIGDGDHGVSMTIGFRGLNKGLAELEGKDIGQILFKSGMNFNSAAGATIGALMGTAFMRAGKVSMGLEEIGIKEACEMLQAASQGIMDKGKAKPGSKTLVDAVVPAAEAMKEGADDGKSLLDALEGAMEAAKEGMESTKDMLSIIGRASRLGERTIGHQDPGATSCYLMFKSLMEYLKGE